MKSIIYYLLFAFLFIGCKQSEEASSDAKMMNIVLPEKNKMEAPVEASVEASNDATPEPAKSESIEPKIIKEGNLRFETNDLEPTYQKIIAATKKQNATIQNDV